MSIVECVSAGGPYLHCDAMDAAGLPLLGVVPEDAQVMLAANRGEPLILMARYGAARAYLNIARRLTGMRVPLMPIR